MNIGVIGINHKLADLTLREALAKACQKYFTLLDPDHAPHRFVLLSTCNRTEIYFSSPHLSEAQSFILNLLRQEVAREFDQKLYSFFRKDCFYHLCRVTAGLDSAVLAETEIQGQVKTAYEHAANQGSIPGVLHFTFQKALKVGKAVRTEIPLSAGLPTLEQAIFSIGSRFFDAATPPRILFVGASHINSKVIDHLHRREFGELTICNRSELEARRWAAKYGISYLDWTRKEGWKEYDLLVFGTRAPKPLLTPKNLPERKRQLIIDLSVPRNVCPKVAEVESASLYNIDQLNRSLNLKKKKIQSLIQNAEQQVMIHSQRLTRCYETRTSRQTLVG